MPQKLSSTLFFVSLMVILASSCMALAAAKPILIRFSHVVTENTPKGMGAKMFQELVEERLAGKVRIEVYPNSEKFTDEQALIGLLFNDVEMAAPSFAKFRRFSKQLQVYDLPFLFENLDQYHAFQQSPAGRKLLASMENKNIKGLAYWDNGMRIISANRPIQNPSDLKGLTFRIEPSHVLQQQYSRLGAIATPMPFNQLVGALEEGVIDGYENAWSNILSQKLYLLRNNFTELGHSYLGYMVVTNASFWNSLPADLRKELEHILEEVTREVNRLATEKESSARKAIIQSSQVNIITLSEEEKKKWRAEMEPLWEKFEGDIGADIMSAAKAAK